MGIRLSIQQAVYWRNSNFRKGGEGYIFALEPEKVIKIYLKADRNYLLQLKQFQNLIRGQKLSLATPEILEIGIVNNTVYTIEKKLNGKPLDTIFLKLSEQQQHEILQKYFQAMTEFNSIKLNSYPYGQILKSSTSVTADNWQEFILKKLIQRAHRSEGWLRKDVKKLEIKLQYLQQVIKQEINCNQKNLVHCDYYFNNVLVNDDLEISAVLDFSQHSVVGDKRLDATSVCFLTLDPSVTETHLQFAKNIILDLYGKEIEKLIDVYSLYYAIYYADTYEFDKNSYLWCLSILNNQRIWNRLGL